MEWNRNREQSTYSAIMWQVALLSYDQSHLIKGLWSPLSMEMEPMAAPLHGCPLIFHWADGVEILHSWNIEFKTLAAIKFTIIHHWDLRGKQIPTLSWLHSKEIPPSFFFFFFKSSIFNIIYGLQAYGYTN
jgi:hypothetical protein